MKEIITIRNFGPLINFEQIEVKPMTVLIGESATGKSTFMKLVALMRYLFKKANIRSYLKLSNITSPFRIRFETMIAKSGLANMLSADSLIEYRVTIDQDEYVIRVTGKKLGKLPDIKAQHLLLSKISYISENRNVIPAWTEKASQNSGAALGFYFHETNNDFANASQMEKVVPLNFLDAKLHITHPKGKVTQYHIEHTNPATPNIKLQDASSGMQSAIPIAIITKFLATEFSFKDAFYRSVLDYLHEIDKLTHFQAVTEHHKLQKFVHIHVEEPELSLFPNAQCKLIEELVLAAKNAVSDRSVSLMLATHSPYILNYLNILINQTALGRAHIPCDNIAVIRTSDGTAQNLLTQNEKQRWLVDTTDLTEMMSTIYNEFIALDND